jgi:ribosomal protein S27AE
VAVSIPEALRSIADLDATIDDLQEQRDRFTDPLEKAAMAYHEGNPASHPPNRLSCSRCHFVFWRQEQEVIHFGTDCSWCGKDSGSGLTVHIQRLEPFMK